MPESYDFSVRNINWKDYNNDFILRTDAVWEKTKLKDYFYSMYKNFLYDDASCAYYVTDLRIHPLPTNEADHFEAWTMFKGYSNIDGCVWQFRTGPAYVNPVTFSHYTAEKEGDSWYQCYVNFQKFMKCNEKSEFTLDEAQMYNGGFWKYPCFEEVDRLFEHCGADLFEIMYETYRMRIHGNRDKAPQFNRIQMDEDPIAQFADKKVLKY